MKWYFYKTVVRHGRSQCNFEEMRGEAEYFSNGRTIKETDSDWQLGEQWEQQYL